MVIEWLWSLRSETAWYRREYQRLRDRTYEVMLLELAPFLNGRLTDLTAIDDRTLAAWQRQWRPAMPPEKAWSHWDWREEAKGWSKHIDRFEVAAWSDGQLGGLAIGKPSPRRNNLSVYLLQGSPLENHPLKGEILAIVLDVAEAYGTALGCRELRLVKPLDGIIGKYRKLGFRLERPKKAAPYCVRSI